MFQGNEGEQHNLNSHALNNHYRHHPARTAAKPQGSRAIAR
jgi:hypothetical protein